MKNPQIAFIIMPFGKEPEEQKYFHDISNLLFKPVLSKLGYQVLRADDIGYPGSITKDIIKYLHSANLVIADLSNNSPNVFYELGIRHTLHKSGTILVCKKGNIIPFDISNYKILFYETGFSEAEHFKKQLKSKILESKNQISSSNPVYDFLKEEFQYEEDVKMRLRQNYDQLFESINTILFRLVRSFGSEFYVFLGDNLINKFGETSSMLFRIRKIRFELALECEILLPAIRLRDDPRLSPNSYQIVFEDNEIITGNFDPDHAWVFGDITGFEEFIVEKTIQPNSGEISYKVHMENIEKFYGRRFNIYDPELIFGEELKRIFKKRLELLIEAFRKEKTNPNDQSEIL